MSPTTARGSVGSQTDMRGEQDPRSHRCGPDVGPLSRGRAPTEIRVFLRGGKQRALLASAGSFLQKVFQNLLDPRVSIHTVSCVCVGGILKTLEIVSQIKGGVFFPWGQGQGILQTLKGVPNPEVVRNHSAGAKPSHPTPTWPQPSSQNPQHARNPSSWVLLQGSGPGLCLHRAPVPREGERQQLDCGGRREQAFIRSLNRY